MNNQSITVREFFQTQYLDTGAIPQSFIDKYKGKTKGYQPNNVDRVTVGDITFGFNGRRPKASKIKDYIRQEDGINWWLFETLKLAKVDGGYDVWDALHRAIMTCVVLGPDAEVPATFTHFDSGKDVHSTFWKVNGPRSKKVTPEQQFIAKIRADDAGDLEHDIMIMLEKSGNTVVYEDDEIYEPTRNTTDWHIKYAPCKDMVTNRRLICQQNSDIDWPDYSVIVDAIHLYQKVFYKSYRLNEKPKLINSQVIKALSLVLDKNYQWFRETSTGGWDGSYPKQTKTNREWFETFLLERVKTEPSISEGWLFKEWPHDRMEKRHFGTAYGLWKKFVTWYDFNVKNSNCRPDVDTFKSLYYNSLPNEK